MHGNNDQLASFWMPVTANRAFKSHPRQLVSASGMYYQSGDGRQLLDGTAGLWCSNAGHCRPEITEAIARTAATLDFAPTFQLGHPLPFELAQRLAALMPEGLDRIFFTSSGSESVDTALKIALNIQRAKGEGTRTRLIGRERGYHGTGFGGISVGRLVNNRRAFGGGLPGVDHLRHAETGPGRHGRAPNSLEGPTGGRVGDRLIAREHVRQRPDVAGALDVVLAAEGVDSRSRQAEVAEQQLEVRAGIRVGGPARVLGDAHGEQERPGPVAPQ